MSAPLKIRFATDVDGAKQGMASLAASVASNALSMASALRAANDNVQTLRATFQTLSAARAILPALAVGAAAVAVGMAVVGTAVGQANDQLDRFIKLGENAERSGVGVEFFQRFGEAAEKAKLSVAEVEGALRKAGEAVTPKFEQEDAIKKRLNELFETGYLGAFQSKGLADYNAASSNEGRIRAAVDAMRELNSLGERLAAIDLAEKLFGAETADRIRRGRLDIEEIANSLDRQRDDLVSAEEVARADEFRTRLSEAYAEIDKALGVSANLSAEGRAFLDAWLAIVEAVASASKAADGLLAKMAQASKDSQDMLGRLATAMGAQSINQYLFPNQGRTVTTADDPQTTITPIQAPTPPRRPLSFFTERDRPETGGGSKAKAPASESLDQVATFINGIERSTEALKAEADAIGKSATERQAAINVARLEAIARQQGITLTAEQIAKTRELSAETVKYREALEDARDRQDAIRSTGGDVLKGILSDARSGASALNVMTNALDRLITRLSDKALDGLADTLFGRSGGTQGGLLSGLFGGASAGDIFGFLTGSVSPIPGFAAGGEIPVGSYAIVGEKGPELIAASATARTVIPNGGTLARMPDGGGSGNRSAAAPVNMTNANTYNITPANGVTIPQLQAFFAEHDRNINGTILARIETARLTYG